MWADKKQHVKNEWAGMRMLRWMCGNMLRDRIKKNALGSWDCSEGV